MKVAILLLPVVLLFSGSLIAQDDDQPAPSSHPVPDTTTNTISEPKINDAPLLSAYGRANQLNYIIEPDLDLGSVNHQVNVGVAPSVGHKIWKGLYAGAGMVFIYSGVQNDLLADINGQLYYGNAHSITYGGGVYVQYNIWKGLYVRVRFDLLHRRIEDFEDATVLPNSKTGVYAVYVPVLKMNIPDLPVGVGYNILVKKKLFLPIKVSYNVLYPFLSKQYTVYPDGWIVKLCIFNIF
jgi:hypothetical protein